MNLKTLILSKDWEFINGRRSFGYPHSIEHLQPVNEKACELYTFGITYSDKRQTRHGDGPSSIAGFQRSITRKWLQEGDGNGLASDQPS